MVPKPHQHIKDEKRENVMVRKATAMALEHQLYPPPQAHVSTRQNTPDRRSSIQRHILTHISCQFGHILLGLLWTSVSDRKQCWKCFCKATRATSDQRERYQTLRLCFNQKLKTRRPFYSCSSSTQPWKKKKSSELATKKPICLEGWSAYTISSALRHHGPNRHRRRDCAVRPRVPP
ncbi:hypothetical protein K469DRAFT_270157 [Zopfia rhizophila CBS 207.26]|uniref:Uncharacterized protein n=1 Tax=Zopfia rhizophila CBS 207.26 TaxID=1314779 RepID=A0A6A6DP18_9PEZI|nr:hypothetical protein K469DRAFT_270157 [Zopfia rhizophila CBS 207.26]